jgi:hypothetical protein
MKTSLKLLAFVFTMSAAAGAQVAPAATGSNSVPLSGNLQYALRYSQSSQFSNILPNLETSTASGTLDYANGNDRLPFFMDYSGGYTWTITGPSYETGLFQHMLLSQGINWRKWALLVSDNVSYLPQSPTTGFSGIPGIGEPIGTPNPAPSTSQTILTLNTHVIDNAANGELDHTLSYATTVGVGGSSEILRYPDGNGLDTNTQGAYGQIVRRLDSRNSLLGKYSYSQYSYPGSTVSIQTHTALFGFQRRWSRNFRTDVNAGPEWIASSDNLLVPTSTNFAANASLRYVLRLTSTSLSYSHGTNGGSGYFIGGEIDTVEGNFSRDFGMNLTIGLTGGYERTNGLNNNGVTNGGVTDASYGGAQATWRLSRNLIAFANYTGTYQTSTSALPTNILNEQLHVLGFGIGFSPRATHLRQ